MATPIVIYFLKVNLALALLYCGYRLLFRNDTFFKLRRGILLSIYLIAFLYPLPDLSGWLSTQTSMTEIVGYYSEWLPKETVVATGNEATATDWKAMSGLILQGIYLTGIGLLLFRCLAELCSVFRQYKRCRKITLNGSQVCLLPEAEASYSFFGWIFLSPNPKQQERLDDILIHEQTHVRQWHSIDMVAGEIVCILCWVNPFAWWIKEEIGINHEFIADEQVMLSGFDKKEYQYHLIGIQQPNRAIANLYNHFSVLPLKKRITMLNRKRTSNAGKAKYLAFIPMAAGLLLLNNIDAMARVLNGKVAEVILQPTTLVATTVSETGRPLPPDDDKIYQVCDVIPEFPGGQNELLQYLAKSIKYPEDAIKQKIQGRVSVTFVIEKDGSVSNIEVARSVSPSLDKEAIRVISNMPKWTPGKLKDGKVVRVAYTCPVVYHLQ